MTTNRVFCSYTETYDFNTVPDQITVLGIHTPKTTSIRALFSGLWSNFKKIRINSCDFALACASQLAVDPLQVATEPGFVDPRDVLNPLLFKAVTGERLANYLEQIYNKSNTTEIGSSITDGSMSSNVDSLSVYYTLLSDESFRKAHPQQGLIVNNLVPMVHKVVSTRPFRPGAGLVDINDDDPGIRTPYATTVGASQPININASEGTFGLGSDSVQPMQLLSNGITPMPAFDTKMTVSGSNKPINVSVPKTYCGLLVCPPALQQKLYFRLRIRWNIEFLGIEPNSENLAVSDLQSQIVNPTYVNAYTSASETSEASIAAYLHDGEVLDVNGVEGVTKINSAIV